MSRWGARLLVVAAVALAALAVVVPVGAMLWSSFRVEEVVTGDGRVWSAVGEVHEQPDRGDPSRRVLVFATQSGPGAEKVPQRIDVANVHERRKVLSLSHYRFVFGDPRTRAILVQSLALAGGSALLALLLGLPVAWALARCAFFGRRMLAALTLGPVLLPAFVLGMGAARPFSGALEGLLGLSGRALQMGTAMLLFAATLYPVVVLLVGRAWAAVPAGPYEAARLLRGPRAAWRLAVLPALLPAAAGAALAVVLLALADFAVPDLMSFLVPGGSTPMAVFAKEVQLQWKQEGNTGRAVATGAPLLLLCLVALVLAFVLLRKGPLLAAARTGRVRPARVLGWRGTLGAWLVVLAPLTLGLVIPLGGILSWAGAGGQSVASGSLSPGAQASAGRGSLGDLSGALDRTPGSRDERDRWLQLGLGATVLTLGVAFVLARWAQTSGTRVRAGVGGLAALALACPGVVIGIGTLLLGDGRAHLRETLDLLALAADRALLFVLAAALWLWGRSCFRGLQERGVAGWYLRRVVWGLGLGLSVTVFAWSDGRPCATMLSSAGLALVARLLPFALLGVTLALREVRRGYEEAAATLGAGPGARALHVTLPLAGTGIAAAGLLVLILALREIDAVVLLETRLFPLRIYDKVHYSQWADEANLTLLYLAWLLAPALVAALLLGWRQRRGVR